MAYRLETLSLADDDVFLGDSINSATRSVHTKLNKLILRRLPLAIRPGANDSSAYTQGILHIAPLYIAFESLWHAILHEQPDEKDSSSDRHSVPEPRSSSPEPPFPFRGGNPVQSHIPKPSRRIYTVLNQMFMPGLLRSARLRSDLRSLAGWSDDVAQSQLEEVATTGRLGEIVSHIRRATEKHPHVLLAYAWVLYMALFSGGRFIRATLESAGGDGFWESVGDTQERKGESAARDPLGFFHFSGPQDGEDLKAEFQRRLAQMGKLLTETEREDIVREAMCVFENLILVISQLDDVCHTKLSDMSPLDSVASLVPTRTSPFRIRDSVIVTRERSYRAAKRREGSAVSSPGEESTSSPDEETSEPTTRLPSEAESDSGAEEKPARHASCHTVQSASSSSAEGKTGVAPQNTSAGNTTRDLDPGSFGKIMHFDSKLPTPDRTPSGTGPAKQLEQGLEQGSENEDGPVWDDKADVAKGLVPPINRKMQVAISLAWVVAAVGFLYCRQ